ncbi:hypothetical protein TNCV_2366581 [Trichonephila clavipes]|nr:hypothetical protein TNCV_2366581 [Trichonephila clavipes]
MGVCKCVVPLLHEGTLKRRRATSPLVWFSEEEGMWEASDPPWVVFLKTGEGTEENRTDTCMVLKDTANDRRTTGTSSGALI